MTTRAQTLPRTGRAARRRRRTLSGPALVATQVAFGLVVLGGWELASDRLIDTFFISRPTLVAAELVRWIRAGTIWEDLWVTLVLETATGFAVGAVLGVVSGFVLAQATAVARVMNPYVLAIYGIPRIALAPLFIVWFGIGLASKIWLAGMMSFFLAFFNTYTGVAGVDPGLRNVARVMGATRLAIVTKVVLPAAMPWILAGLRVSIPYALVAAVVGEMVMSTKGIGFRIISATQRFDTTGTMAGVVVLMVVVLVANVALDKAEARILRWRPTSPDTTPTQG